LDFHQSIPLERLTRVLPFPNIIDKFLKICLTLLERLTCPR
jgi:hypothetical protein